MQNFRVYFSDFAVLAVLNLSDLPIDVLFEVEIRLLKGLDDVTDFLKCSLFVSAACKRDFPRPNLKAL